MEKITINSQHTLEWAIEVLREVFANDRYLTISWEVGTQRTPQQRKSLEVYCRLVSEALNSAGYDIKLLFEEDPEYEVPWNQAMIKEHYWGPIMTAMTGHTSTTQCNRVEYGQIFEVMAKNLATKQGVSVAWPEKERENG